MNRIPENGRNGHHREPPSILSMRLPPQNLEAEKGVLGSIFRDESVIPDVCGILNAEDFYRNAHQIMFRAILLLHAAGKPVDPLTVSELIDQAGELSDVGGLDYFTEVVESVPHSVNAAYYAGIVREKATARRLVEEAELTIRECYSNSYTAGQLIASAEARLHGVTDAATTLGEPVSIYDSGMQVLELIEHGMKGEVVGVSTGYDELDYMIDGLMPEALYVVGARPNVGKSLFAMAVASNVAMAGKNVLFFSLEMSHKQLTRRFLSAHAGVRLKTIKNPTLLSHEENAMLIGTVGSKAYGTPLYMIDQSSMTVQQISAACRRHRARHSLDLVIVDYLQIVEAERLRNDTRENEVASVAKALKGLAKALQVPVLALAQLNRALETRADRTPILADMRESGVIEACADVAMLLHRPEMYNANDRPGVFQVIVAKGRDCDTGTVDLSIDRYYQRLSDPRKGPIPDAPFPADSEMRIYPPTCLDPDAAY